MNYDWQQVKIIFAGALRENAENRTQFILEQCGGNKTLEREVRSLLSSYINADLFLETPAVSEVAGDFTAAAEAGEFKDGDFLKHYRITKKIGKGGMGEVYLAQDTRLGRHVAIKILGAYFGNNKTNLKRFIIEARAASSLNHPNIVVIHEIDETNGTNYIVSEYIEGRTLTEVLQRKNLSLSQICDMTIQVLKALAAAHEVGIVHRDIKSDNIMVRDDGIVKVLDFGLAKLVENKYAEVDADEKTLEMINTRSGMILGTIPYMSPEQTRGKVVDTRTDIWSFGVLLYQLLTRKLPFQGDTNSDLMAAILKSEPLPVTQIAPHIPVKFERIVQKALVKNPDERFQTVNEILDELKSFRRGLEFGVKTEPLDIRVSDQIEQDNETDFKLNKVTAKDSENAGSSQRFSLVSQTIGRTKAFFFATLFFLVSCAALLTIGYLGWSKLIPSFRATDTFQKMRLTKLTFEGRATQWVTVSPDGKYIGYILQNERLPSLMIRQAATSAVVELVPPADVEYKGLTFAPDGNFIYYIAGKKNTVGELYKIPVLGGNPRKILDDISGPVTFSPDGQKMAFVRASTTVMMADSNGESEQVLAPAVPRETRLYLDWSPDGQTIVSSVYSIAENRFYVSEISPADGVEKRLPTPPWLRINGLKWLADSSGLIICGRDPDTKFSQIWHVSYPDGELRRITNDFSTYVDISLPADNKSLFAVKQERLFNIWMAPDETGQNARRITVDEGRDEGMSGILWTPDGKIIYSVRTTINLDLWMVNADGTNNHQLIFNQGSNFFPEISPDGKFIVFVSDRSGNLNIWRTDIDGSNPVQLTDLPDAENYPSFTPDGKFLLYQRKSADNKTTIWKLNLEDAKHTRLTETETGRPVVSPDGKFFACEYGAAVPGQPVKLAIFPIDGGPPARILDLPKVIESRIYRWTPDGKSLMYVESRDRIFNIWSQPLDLSPPKQLTFFESGEIGKFDLSPDGKSFALARGNESSDVVMISNFK